VHKKKQKAKIRSKSLNG